MQTITRTRIAQDDSIAGMIAAQPGDALALAANWFRLTYGQLNARTTALAQGLQLLGVGPDVPIAVFANRTPAGIVGALSVLKAGGGYVPLDPSDPTDRIEFILRDAQAPFVLAERGLAARLPKGAWRVIPLDEAPLVFSKPMETPVPAARHHLAYIQYTSGSTGRPQGVEVTHANLLNLIHWHRRTFNVTAADTASQLAPAGLSAAVWEVWPYLTAGASLHFPFDRTRASAPALREWLSDEYITMAYAPAAMAEQLITLEWPCTTALRFLLTSGDVLRRCPPAGLPFKLVNNYGSTETTVVATSECVPPRGTGREYPTIGRPIDNVRLVVVDESLQLVRDGAAGELCIGGAGVARGYLNQPELTARKFIPDLFCGDPRARLYRTGDIVRRLSDGQYAFVGRTDDQIKIHGRRVEPAEIEAALNDQPGVQRSVAMVREDTPGRRRLVAYVVPAEGDAISTAAIQESLRVRLPNYMLPEAIVSVSELPLTPDGAVDRTALPAQSAEADLIVHPAVAVRLAQIVSSLLEADKIAYDANFFQMGGHPLLGALVLNRVQDVFGVSLTPQQLFDSPTISGLAAEIERAAALCDSAR